jgi:hypothetical protein
MFCRTSSLLRYGVGVLVIPLAFLLILVLHALLRPDFPGHIASPLFLLAVVLSAWYGGKGPGLFTAVLSYLTLEFVFLPPIYSVDLGWEDIPLAGVFGLAAVVISTLDGKRRRAEEAVGRSEERMRMARRFQERLCAIAPPNLTEFDVAAMSQPAETTGGDYFDFIPMRDGRIAFVVGDVSGHDFGAALLMSEVRAYLRALVLVHDDVSEILTLTNSILVEDTDDGAFVTLFFACLDPRHRSLVYAGAGHEASLIHPTGRRERLQSTCLPLGLEKDLVVASAPAIHLEPEAVVLLISDGIHDASSQRGERFGLERTIELIRAHRDQTANEMIDVLRRAVRAFSDGVPQTDDQTALIVKARTLNRTPPSVSDQAIGAGPHASGAFRKRAR